MEADSKATTGRKIDRINLRLAGDRFAQIDAACSARPGTVSRNTWIAEAVEEKLARETAPPPAQASERRVHG